MALAPNSRLLPDAYASAPGASSAASTQPLCGWTFRRTQPFQTHRRFVNASCSGASPLSRVRNGGEHATTRDSHIGLSTLDLDATRTFYERVLGFRLVTIEQID